MTFIFIHLHLQLALMATMEPPPLVYVPLNLKGRCMLLLGLILRPPSDPLPLKYIPQSLKKPLLILRQGPAKFLRLVLNL